MVCLDGGSSPPISTKAQEFICFNEFLSFFNHEHKFGVSIFIYFPNSSTPATDCFCFDYPTPQLRQQIVSALIIQLLNSGNRLFWGALKLSWYFAATADLLPLVVSQSSSCPQSSSGKFSENKCCLRVENLRDHRFSPRHFCLTYCYLGVCKSDFA